MPYHANRNRNAFQAVVDSPEFALYSERARDAHSTSMPSERFERAVIEEAVRATECHRQSRARAITARSGSSLDRIVEVLRDPHYRKQRNMGPNIAQLAETARRAHGARRPIELIALMFTRKNICPLKRPAGDESTIDLAEILSLVHLDSFAQLLAEFHPYGAKLMILGEGRRFLEAFSLTEDVVRDYQAGITDVIRRLRLKHLEYRDYEDFLSQHLSPSERAQREGHHQEARRVYESRMLPILDAENMTTTLQHAIERDPIGDSLNPRGHFVPLWDSIKHSIPYPVLETEAARRGIAYEQFYRETLRGILEGCGDGESRHARRYAIEHSWAAAIAHNARLLGDIHAGIDVARLLSDSALRATINPKPDSQQLGIHAARETTRRVQPWHGTAFLEMHSGRVRSTVLSRLELESRGAYSIALSDAGGKVMCYADDATRTSLLSGNRLVFDTSMR